MAASSVSINQLHEIRSALLQLPDRASANLLPQKLMVTFGGELGDRFGVEHEWHRRGSTDQVPDAIKNISVNCPELIPYLYSATSSDQLFAVMIDGLWCQDDLDFACYLGNAKSIHVEPLVYGAGGNLVKGLIGVALIGVGIAAGATGVLGIPGGSLILMGSSMLASAAIGALFNRPIIKKDDETDKRKNSYFSGATQNALGKEIPRLYGTSVREIPGTNSVGINAVVVGRRIPVNVVSYNVNYVEIDEAES